MHQLAAWIIWPISQIKGNPLYILIFLESTIWCNRVSLTWWTHELDANRFAGLQFISGMQCNIWKVKQHRKDWHLNSFFFTTDQTTFPSDRNNSLLFIKWLYDVYRCITVSLDGGFHVCFAVMYSLFTFILLCTGSWLYSMLFWIH